MRKILLVPVFISVIVLSCTKDKYEVPIVDSSVCDTLNASYDSHIKSIIDVSCAISGCHESGAGIGDFTSFTSLQPYLDNGRFETRVITQKDMPPSYATIPALTDSELAQISCWIESNTPEN